MCKLVLTLEATSIFVSTLSIIAIALDRYYVILCSVNPENCRQERVPILLKLVIIWIIGLILSLPLFLVRTVESHFIGKMLECYRIFVYFPSIFQFYLSSRIFLSKVWDQLRPSTFVSKNGRSRTVERTIRSFRC